ncbi:MAG: hypothetical protein E7647_03155 [Ruminococcaceae bacterium]|nr:hypothetical protein [Oscillospiraceae bacterium]
MKKIICAILLLAMALTLFSCAKYEGIVLDTAKISSVEFVLLPDADVDKTGFVEAFNAAKITGAADEDDKSGNDVIVIPFANGNDVVTLYYLGNDSFAVTGNFIEKSYIIKSSALTDIYNGAVDPQPEFVKIDGSYEATLVKKPGAEIDTAALVKYYNECEISAKAEDQQSDDTVVITCNDGEYTVSLSYLGDNLFRVSGSEIKVDYIIKSKELANLYTEAVK